MIASVDVGLGKHNILNDLGEVSQVELVVELGCRWFKLRIFSDRIEDWASGVDNLINHIFAALVKVAEVAGKNLTIDRVKSDIVWKTKSHSSEVALQTQVNIERTTYENTSTKELNIHMIKTNNSYIIN